MFMFEYRHQYIRYVHTVPLKVLSIPGGELAQLFGQGMV